jgi:hypothetical protein
MREELGVKIEGWRYLGRMDIVIEHKRDSLHCFQAELTSPEVMIDLGELSAAEWFPARRLPDKMGRYTRVILDRMLEPV